MKPLRIDAVLSAGERPVLAAMESQLQKCLTSACGAWPVFVREREALAGVDPSDPPCVVVTSLLRDLESDESVPAIAARWRADLAALAGDSPPPVLMCTIFRHTDDPSRRERLRRLNLMAIELSHETGIGVVDIDRAFSQQGARALAADYRLAGPLAAVAAAHTIVASILRMGLDDLIPHDVQERAQEMHGDLRDLVKRYDAMTSRHA